MESLSSTTKQLKPWKPFASYNPFIPATINMLGVFYELSARYDRAVEMYERALELQPRFPEAQNNLNRINGIRKIERGRAEEGSKN